MIKDVFLGPDLKFGQKSLRIKLLMEWMSSSHVRWAYQKVRGAYLVSSLTLVKHVVRLAYVLSTPIVLTELT